MFRSTGNHKVRCNGAGTKRRWWIVAADHTTKSSKLLSQYMNCFSSPLDILIHCLALTGMSLKKLSPATLQKTSLAWLWRAGMENKEEPCFCVERTRPFDVCRHHRQRLNPWSRRKKTKKLFFKKTNYLKSWTLASFGLTDWPVSSGTSETFWFLAAGLANVGLPMAAGGYLLIVLGFGTGKAPLSLADTQRGKYNIEAEFTVDMLV